MPCHKRATGRYTSKALHRLTRSHNTGTVGTRGARGPQTSWRLRGFRLRRNPDRMNASLKLMAVQVNTNDLPDRPDKIKVPDVAENFRLELIELGISWTL